MQYFFTEINKSWGWNNIPFWISNSSYAANAFFTFSELFKKLKCSDYLQNSLIGYYQNSSILIPNVRGHDWNKLLGCLMNDWPWAAFAFFNKTFLFLLTSRILCKSQSTRYFQEDMWRRMFFLDFLHIILLGSIL